MTGKAGGKCFRREAERCFFPEMFYTSLFLYLSKKMSHSTINRFSGLGIHWMEEFDQIFCQNQKMDFGFLTPHLLERIRKASEKTAGLIPDHSGWSARQQHFHLTVLRHGDFRTAPDWSVLRKAILSSA